MLSLLNTYHQNYGHHHHLASESLTFASTLIPILRSNPKYTHVTPPKHNSPQSYSHPHALPLSYTPHLTLPILTLLLILPTPTHLFCTSLMVIFSEFDDLLWMHVYHVHVVMHIVMLKWCIRFTYRVGSRDTRRQCKSAPVLSTA